MAICLSSLLYFYLGLWRLTWKSAIRPCLSSLAFSLRFNWMILMFIIVIIYCITNVSETRVVFHVTPARGFYKRTPSWSVRSNNSVRLNGSLRILLICENFTMTFKMCFNVLGLVCLCVLVSLSSRISEEIQRGVMLTTAVRLIHLFSFGTFLGMQFWVTFIAGE